MQSCKKVFSMGPLPANKTYKTWVDRAELAEANILGSDRSLRFHLDVGYAVEKKKFTIDYHMQRDGMHNQLHTYAQFYVV